MKSVQSHPGIVAMRGDYLADATALREMAFVMKGGRVFKYQP
jgi:hypothetical protein